jgi:hypothetical protein
MPKKSGPAWDLSAIYLDEVGILGGQSLLTQKITANVETFDGVLPEDNCPALSEINSDLSALQDLRADYDSLFLKLSSFKQKYPAQASTAKIDAIESHLLVRQSDLEATISASTKFYNSLEEFCGVGA